MNAAAWSAWLAILIVPWLSAAAIATGRAGGRFGLQMVGLVWCLAAAMLLGVLDEPLEIDAGTWFAIPLPQPLLIRVGWIASAGALWGIAASGLVLWWSCDEGQSALLISVICGAAAQVWFVDNVWLLLVAQFLLTALTAVGLRSRAASSLPSFWIAAAWADGLFALTMFRAAVELESFEFAEISNPERMAELESVAPGSVALIGLLLGTAFCGRCFQFPFSGIRDLAGSSPAAWNSTIWGVALLPVAVRWFEIGQAWWTTNSVLIDLAQQWSAVAGLVMVWCALASPNLPVRLSWLFGAQIALGLPAGVSNEQIAVETWSTSFCAATWLWQVAVPREESSATSSGFFGLLMAWLAATVMCGLAIWPAIPHEISTTHWITIVRTATWMLFGVSTIQIAASANGGRVLGRGVILAMMPLALAFVFGQTGAFLLESVNSNSAMIGWSAAVAGMILGLVWRRIPRESRSSLISPLEGVGRVRLLLPAIFKVGAEWPIRGAAQLARFSEWVLVDGAILGTLRRAQRDGDFESELQSAGPEFYALALGLVAAAVTLTVMWLAA